MAEYEIINNSEEFNSYQEINEIILFSKYSKFFLVVFLFYIDYYLTVINKSKSNSNINPIHLSLSINNNYLYPAIVYLTSLLDNRANSTFYNIHLLTEGDLTKDSLDKIKSVINDKKYGNNVTKLFIYNLGNDFEGATTDHLSLSTYYRIALPSLLPNVDKIIYTDSDVINLEDLTEMYNFKLNRKAYFAGTLDFKFHLRQFRMFGLSSDKYINTGILIMNLKAMREDSNEKKLREFISNHTLIFHDQTAINCVCINNIQILPYKYGIFSFESFKELFKLNKKQAFMNRCSKTKLKKFFAEPTFYHYASRLKPWNKNVTKFNKVYWWYYAKMSGFYKEILAHYNVSLQEIETLLNQIPNDGGLLKRNFKKNYINN